VYDAGRAALDVAGEPACLPLEVKAKRQGVHVAENLQGHPSHGALRHLHEHHVPKLIEQRGRRAQEAVGGKQRDRNHQQRLLRRQPVDDRLHDQRHAEVGDLGRDEECDRQEDSARELLQVREQLADDANVTRDGRLARGGCGRGGLPGRLRGAHGEGLMVAAGRSRHAVLASLPSSCGSR